MGLMNARKLRKARNKYRMNDKVWRKKKIMGNKGHLK